MGNDEIVDGVEVTPEVTEEVAPEVTEEVAPEEVEEVHIEEEDESDKEITPSTPVKMYEGKEVISEGTRTVNDKPYHTIRVADGSSYDLTAEEYALKVTE